MEAETTGGSVMAVDDLNYQYPNVPSVTGFGSPGPSLDIPSIYKMAAGSPGPSLDIPSVVKPPALAGLTTPGAQRPTLAGLTTPRAQLPPQTPHDFTLRPELKQAMMHQESRGDPRARGMAGEVGRMQVP